MYLVFFCSIIISSHMLLCDLTFNCCFHLFSHSLNPRSCLVCSFDDLSLLHMFVQLGYKRIPCNWITPLFTCDYTHLILKQKMLHRSSLVLHPNPLSPPSHIPLTASLTPGSLPLSSFPPSSSDIVAPYEKH